MKQITLETLSCVEAGDTSGDECRLEVHADGELRYAYRKHLDAGETWSLDESMLFSRSCDLRLFDDDVDFPGDDDDALGVVSVSGPPVLHGTATFRQDEADYRLTYRVIERPDITADDLATFAIDQFEASSAPGVWPQIAKPTLIAELRERRSDATHVSQVHSDFCGPTSIAYELVRTQPRRYVDLCRQLYETGGFWSRTHRVDAPSGLRTKQVGQGMEAADWMLIATMRDDENAIFSVSPDASGLIRGAQGLTTHWEMEGWTSEILLKDDVASRTTFVWGEIDALRYAQQVWAGGGSAFFMIQSDMLRQPSRVVPPWPDHWVVYQGGLDETGGRVRFDVYTWGTQRSLDITADHFERCMFGIVTGS